MAPTGLHTPEPSAASALLREPDVVLRLDRMGSYHQTRLSFARALLRRLDRDGWRVSRARWDIDARGVGVAVYEARSGEGRVYSLVAFAHELPAEQRFDRVIAEAWDATFALHDGSVSDAAVERLSRNVPLQEAGRCSAAELVMARANRSVRLFDAVVTRLAEGRQPNADDLDAVGYLMRTTAVYGGGKFGLSDRARIADRPEFAGPFSAEMLAVWLIRAFTIDLVEHMAQLRAPDTAVRLAPALRRRLGVGNSTGLGMAPFVVNHPALFHRWIAARETALARVRAVPAATAAEIEIFRDRLARGRAQMAAWRTTDAEQQRRIRGLASDLEMLAGHVMDADLSSADPWERLHAFAEAHLGLEAQEFLVTLLLEPYGALVDDLVETMGGHEAPDLVIDGAMRVGALRAAIERTYRYALDIDFGTPEAQARFWYVSTEKLEPRLGERASEDGAALEQPLGVGRDVAALHAALGARAQDDTVAALLACEPGLRHAVRRVQLATRQTYSEIRDNVLSATMRPIDILRCKLSFFGATDFDPRSDRWVRIALFRHAPFPEELGHCEADDWAIPPLGAPVTGPLRPDPAPAPAHPPQASAEPLPGFSLSEIEAELRKAARGSGLDWGLADEAGRAARELAAADPRLLESVTDALEAVASGAVALRMASDGTRLRRAGNGGGPLSSLALGPNLEDWAPLVGEGGLVVEGAVADPRLLAPWLCAVVRRTGHPLLIEAGGASAEIDGDVAAAVATLGILDGSKGFRLARLDRPARLLLAAAPRPVIVAPDLQRRIGRLSARTYVEASETSRLRGAGAGTSDND